MTVQWAKLWRVTYKLFFVQFTYLVVGGASNTKLTFAKSQFFHMFLCGHFPPLFEMVMEDPKSTSGGGSCINSLSMFHSMVLQLCDADQVGWATTQLSMEFNFP
eukprot:Lithocolla_globosa_v1_NODE_4324_length_1463_cov_2.737926.p5 type:complete len:104 gc:universal NODE_4324_length_1463_cov_2.737926:923-612(-)